MSEHESSNEVVLKYGIPNHELLKAAELFDQAFSGKFGNAIPRKYLRIKFWSEILNPEQIVGAYLENELVGIALLTFENRPGFLQSAQKSLFKILGPFKGLRAALYFVLFSKLDKKTQFPNVYLEAISVSVRHRGMGIGNQLIEEARKIAKNEGNSSLLLQVVLENSSAKKLYEHIGFTVISTSSTPLLRFFTSVGGAHLMKWEI